MVERNFLLQCLAATAAALNVAVVQAAVDPALRTKLEAMAVPFVPNAGQWDAQAAFAAQTFAGTLFVTQDGRLVYRLPGRTQDAGGRRTHSGAPEGSPHAAQGPAGPGWVLTETLIDARDQARQATPAGLRPQEGKVSYAIGSDESRHRDGLPAYERVRLGEVYPGIDVQLRATGTNVEKIFTVEPRIDPTAIRVRLDGARKLEVGTLGELIAHTGNGPVAYTAPVAYQEDARGNRTEVPVRYALDAASRSYGFALGAYDRDRPLVIDPLLQSTYIGGTGRDIAWSVAIHPVSGEVYVAGWTTSTDFPKVAGSEQATKAAGGGVGSDGFVTRLNAALTSRLQSTYIGGDGDDSIMAVAIHPINGDVYVAGWTASSNLPKAAGSEQPAKAAGGSGGLDAFVTRLTPTLTTRVQSTYVGGNGDDAALALAIHPATGDIYITGQTVSTDFPKVAGGAQGAFQGGVIDGFVVRLNAALTSRLQSTYLGGSGTDYATALSVHPGSGEVYVTGWTRSTNFPGVAGSEQSALAGTGDVFIARLNPGLTAIGQATYLGGSSADDQGTSIAIHPVTGDVYVGGYTTSVDFPKTTNGSQPTYPSPPSDEAGFVTRLPASLNTRIQSTYFGGSTLTRILGIAIHPVSGDIFATGVTSATDLPGTSLGVQPAIGLAGASNAFVVRINAALTTQLQATYLGGTGGEGANGIAVHPVSGEIYLAGESSSTNLPGTAGSEQTTRSSPFGNAFASRLSFDLRALDSVPNAFSFAPKFNVSPGSQQTSDPVQVTGFLSAPINVVGGNYAQYCISNSASCGSCVAPYGTASATIGNQQYVCVRQNAPMTTPGLAKATVLIGGNWADFVVTTGTQLGSNCTLDADGNGAIDALTDGLLLMRAMFGLTGTAVTTGAVGDNAQRPTWETLQPFLNGNCGTHFAP